MKNLAPMGFPSYSITPDGRVYSSKSNKFLKLQNNGHGYHFCMPIENGVYGNLRIHRAVATMFIHNPNPEEYTQVNHIDGVKTNNHVSNLEWCSPSQNSAHANQTGLRKKPFTTEHTPMPESVIHDWKSPGKSYYRWTEEDAHRAAKLLESGYRVCDISAMTGLDRRGIQFMRDGEMAWGYLASEYNFDKTPRKLKLSVEKIVGICKTLESGAGINETSRIHGVERKVISGIYNRVTHKEVSEQFKW